MSKVLTGRRLGATPGKLALVCVLGVVLVGVLTLGQPGRADSNAARPDRPRPKPGQTTPAESTRTPHLPAPDTRVWPAVTMEELLAHNPFQDPRAPAEPRAQAPRANPSALAELQRQGASIVVIGDGEKRAMIGDRQYKIGDVVNGYQVTDITTSGVVFTEAPRR